MKRILMVCLGNICRSPLAEGILKDKVDRLGLDWSVDSAGTANYHVGEKPHPDSIKVAKANQIDISQQRARQFTAQDFEHFDHILVMDTSNYRDVQHLAKHPSQIDKVQLILSFLPSEKLDDVPDPWYGTYEGYVVVFGLLDRACDAVIENLNK